MFFYAIRSRSISKYSLVHELLRFLSEEDCEKFVSVNDCRAITGQRAFQLMLVEGWPWREKVDSVSGVTFEVTRYLP